MNRISASYAEYNDGIAGERPYGTLNCENSIESEGYGSEYEKIAETERMFTARLSNESLNGGYDSSKILV
ncbi:unnamed protein product [Clonostachys rhizophaga]|uniref:Uncharacterized protein n=1 Tax=Clonostachys rhizophaga TaxID=160324 RepID=A0A9N9YGI3_9HYPO|nr:unnamed protein product [Clonostachys rhizophaga]